MASYPATFDIQRPEKFERTQLLWRLLILLVLSFVSGILGLLYLFVPVYAAILISQKGAEAYHSERGGPMLTLLRWYMAVYAYIDILTDRFPTEKPEEAIQFEVTPGGSPSVGSALLRIILAIPSAFVLGLLGIVGFVIWIIAFISVLLQENYSQGLWDFQLGINRWQARMLAYLASLVDEYPPFALDTGHERTPVTGSDQPPAPETPTQA